jgi:hypothetical protein
MGGTTDLTQMCHAHTANSNYTLDLNFPVDYPDQQPLADYLTQTRDGFVNVANMPGSRNMPYELDIKGTEYRSGLAPLAGTESEVLQVYQNVGGTHPLTWYKAFNYDLTKRVPITFETLFKPGTKPLEVVYPAVVRELQKHSGVGEPTVPSDGLDVTKFQNFAITDDSVIFFFGQGEIAAAAAGVIEAAVPRADLAPLLA